MTVLLNAIAFELTFNPVLFAFCTICIVEPKISVVEITNVSAVVRITGKCAGLTRSDIPSSFSTRPNAMAPRIRPA